MEHLYSIEDMCGYRARVLGFIPRTHNLRLPIALGYRELNIQFDEAKWKHMKIPDLIRLCKSAMVYLSCEHLTLGHNIRDIAKKFLILDLYPIISPAIADIVHCWITVAYATTPIWKHGQSLYQWVNMVMLKRAMAEQYNHVLEKALIEKDRLAAVRSRSIMREWLRLNHYVVPHGTYVPTFAELESNVWRLSGPYAELQKIILSGNCTECFCARAVARTCSREGRHSHDMHPCASAPSMELLQ